jgi:hypothetical protein
MEVGPSLFVVLSTLLLDSKGLADICTIQGLDIELRITLLVHRIGLEPITR